MHGKQEKSAAACCAFGGGEGGIRTRDTFRYTRFPSVRTKPLCDLSESDANYSYVMAGLQAAL